MAVALGYSVVVYTRFKGKVRPEQEHSLSRSRTSHDPI
jgi:hypothetical protein